MRAEAAFVVSIEERLGEKRVKPLKLPKLELLGKSIVFSHQSAFSSASIGLLIKPMVITEPAVPNSGKRAAIRPGFETAP